MFRWENRTSHRRMKKTHPTTPLVELFCHRRLVDNRSVVIRPVVGIFHWDSHLLVPFWFIVIPAICSASSLSSSYWLDHECFTLGSCLCHPLDVSVWPSPDISLSCQVLCRWHAHMPSDLSIPGITHSGLSCSFSVLLSTSVFLSFQFSFWSNRFGVSVGFMSCVMWSC